MRNWLFKIMNLHIGNHETWSVKIMNLHVGNHENMVDKDHESPYKQSFDCVDKNHESPYIGNHETWSMKMLLLYSLESTPFWLAFKFCLTFYDVPMFHLIPFHLKYIKSWDRNSARLQPNSCYLLLKCQIVQCPFFYKPILICLFLGTLI